MKISTRSRYGVRALIYLASRYGEGPVLLRDIAKKEEVSLSYLERLASQLVSAGYLRSARGVKGGVSLAKHPSEINMADVIRALEGEICLVDCVGDPSVCPRSSRCAARDLWVKICRAIWDVLSSMTLQDLLEEQRRKELSLEPMYYI